MSFEFQTLLPLAANAASWIGIVIGSAFCIIGGIGMLRMPDFYTRAHAAGLADTLGAASILIGLVFQAGWSMVSIKLVMVLLFLYVTSPTATHALAKAAYSGKLVAKGAVDPDGARG